MTKLAAAGLRVALAYTNHRPQAGLAADGFAPGEAEEGARLKRFELARRTRYGPAAKNVLISATTRRCSVSSGARWPPSIRTSREFGDQCVHLLGHGERGDAIRCAVHDQGGRLDVRSLAVAVEPGGGVELGLHRVTRLAMTAAQDRKIGDHHPGPYPPPRPAARGLVATSTSRFTRAPRPAPASSRSARPARCPAGERAADPAGP